jgi:AraC-like DNA-binding protein
MQAKHIRCVINTFEMSYQEFQPYHTLKLYIDAYWVMKSEVNMPTSQRIYPDGCIDIIINLGGDFWSDNGTCRMKNEFAYLVGTMIRYVDITIRPDTYLLGIRFKPLGFLAFYKFSSLHEITDRTIDFDKSLLPEMHAYNDRTIAVLNKFFCDRLTDGNHALTEIMETINSRHGIISVDNIAKLHFISNRQLERIFKQQLGLTPKEYSNFIRYQHAVQLIKNKGFNNNLLDVALDAGFYDHAHLTNEIKKYSGVLPSQL